MNGYLPMGSRSKTPKWLYYAAKDFGPDGGWTSGAGAVLLVAIKPSQNDYNL